MSVSLNSVLEQQLLTNKFEKEVKSNLNLTLTQLQILNKVKDVDGSISVSDVKKLVPAPQPAISSSVKHLAKEGYILKERSVEDERTVFLKLRETNQERISEIFDEVELYLDEIFNKKPKQEESQDEEPSQDEEKDA